MPIWKGVVSGLIQGLTEFLPVSSAGHFIIVREILQLNLQQNPFLASMLHVGTLLTIFVAFWHDIKRMLVESVHMVADLGCNFVIWIRGFLGYPRQYHRMIRSSYRKFIALLVVSTIPTGMITVLLKETVTTAGTMLVVPGICMWITALFLLIASSVEEGNIRPREAGYGQAFLIGVSQGIAAMPGLSRSGTTMTACLLCGFEKKFAIKYTFIMAIPGIVGTILADGKKCVKTAFSMTDIPVYGMAMVITALVGYISICIVMQTVQTKKYKGFAAYCGIVGTIVLAYCVWM